MTSNKLKIIAIISMLIDHFAYYFYYAIPEEVYVYCRALGRVSMPIFVYLLVQGYFNTKNIKKYKLRLLIFAVITQCLIIGMKYVNINYYSGYVTNAYNSLNILFSLFGSMLLICLIDRKVIYANTFVASIIDKLIRIFLITFMVILFLKLPFEYKYFVPMLAIVMYIVEKIRVFFEWEYSNFYYKIILGLVVGILLLTSVFILNYISMFSVLSLIFIFMYNGKLGKKSKILKNTFYIFFPLQHVAWYYIAMIVHKG